MTNSAKFMFTFGVITFFVVSIFANKLNLGMNTGAMTDTFMSWLFRLISALAASAVSISLPGLLEIRFTKKQDGTMEIIQNKTTNTAQPSTLADKEPTITASGAIAVFVLVYLFNPIVKAMKQQSILDSARDRRIKVKYSWIMQVLLVLDQFGNVLAGGNSDITISGRAGYHVHVLEGEGGIFWKKMVSIINYTFYPLDGPHHCLMAYCSDKDEHYRGAKLIFKIILVLLIVLFCLLLFIPIRLLALFKSARTHYVLHSGEEIPYADLEITISKVAKIKDPCQILGGFAKKSNH